MPGNTHGMHWIRDERRIAIYVRDHYRCVYCGAGERLTLDHVNPRSTAGVLGRANGSGNLVTSCRPCNREKGETRLGRWVRRRFNGTAPQIISHVARQVVQPVDLGRAKQLIAKYGRVNVVLGHRTR